MAKQKLIRFAENEKFDCLIALDPRDLMLKSHEMKGKWCADFFGNDNPLILEMGCGKGEYTLGLAKLFPDKNFIGIDIKGSRLYHGAKEVHENSIPNAAFIRTKADFIDKIFEREVAEIWVTFPDPFPEKPRRRLTSPFFLNRYLKTLKPGGIVSLKTDDNGLFSFTRWVAQQNNLEILIESEDVYFDGEPDGEDSIKTTYEKKFLQEGKKICLLKFLLDKEVFLLEKKD